MNADSEAPDWLDASSAVSQAELGRMCHLSVTELQELVEYGLLDPLAGRPTEHHFSAACVLPLRQAGALRDRFDLDLFVVGLMYSQFEHIARLEQELRSLHAHLPHPAPARDGPALWHEPHG